MDTYEALTDRLTAALTLCLRALGMAFMLSMLGWILISLFGTLRALVPIEIPVTLLAGYIVGRLHAWSKRRRSASLKTFRSDGPMTAAISAPAHLSAPAFVVSRQDAPAAPETQTPVQAAAKASFAERELAAKEEELKRAAELTARQLHQAIEITEGKVGQERTERDGALVGSVLEVLATNYRLATR